MIPDTPPEPNNHTEPNEAHLDFNNEIEKLFISLIDINPKSFNVWQWQMDLLNLQRRIQKDISAKKTSMMPAKEKAELLRPSRRALWLSRRLGDTLAWLLLKFDRKEIYPYAENSPVPVPEEGHGSRGLECAVAYLASEGWGVPLLHDITSTLRIGDATFIHPERDKNRTVEAKTRYMGLTTDDSGKEADRYDVSVTFLAKIDEQLDIPISQEGNGDTDTERESEGEQKKPRPDRRIKRQTQRMSKVLTKQDAEPNKMFQLDGKDTLALELDSEGDHSNWEPLKRIIDEARTSGYGSTLIDDVFLYIAIHNPDGISDESLKNERITRDISESPLLSSDPSKNCITVTAIPEEESRGAHLWTPFFLHKISQEAIIDMIHGRLVIIIITSVYKFANAIEGDGVKVGFNPKSDPLGSMRFKYVETRKDGVDLAFEIRSMNMHLRECIHEFKSVGYLSDIIQEMRQNSQFMIDYMRNRNQSTGENRDRLGEA